MTDLYSVSFADLLPPNLKGDPDARAAALAVDGHLRAFARDTYKEIVFSNIDALNDATLNALAYDLHIDYYDENLPLHNRRELVRNNLAIHARKGTPWSMERLLTDAFGETQIEEWFDYGGQPYYFRVRVRPDTHFDMDYLQELHRAINQIKNVRSWLEELITITPMPDTYQRIGCALFGSVITTKLPPLLSNNDWALGQRHIPSHLNIMTTKMTKEIPEGGG